MAYQLPDDVTGLSAEDLEAHITQATEAFQARREDPNLTTEDLPELRALAAGIETMRGEQAARVEQASEAQAELDALAAQILGDETETAETAENGETSETGDEPAAAEPAAEEEPADVAAAAQPRRPVVTLNSVRQRQPRQPVPAAPAAPVANVPEIVASVDMPGIAPGAGISMDTLTEGITRRASALATSGGGTGIVASYRLPFDEASGLVVNDPGNAAEGLNAVLKASDQRRLPKGDLVASGGWCAPSETVYEITDIACPDGLWDLPEIQMSRGGLRFFETPTLDVNAMTWIWTEADDISAADGDPTKPCFKIPCPEPTEVRCEAIGVCLEAGILTSRHFPELVAWYQRNVMVAHEMRIRRALYEQARAASTAVTLPVSFASFSAVFGAVALQAVDIQEKHNLCERIGLEVVFPYWSRAMFMTDIARRSQTDVCDLPANCIEDAFASLGVRVQWAKGLVPGVPTDIGGATPATAWPETVEFLVYPTGNFQLGRGAEVNLGVIHDSTKFRTNDFTAIFAEECVALVNRGIEARRVTVPVCADGSVGPRAVPACPIA
ncbi:major capsid protein [[Kitasatospora] papulosa]|uniref:major capsid protein n=1 Tax=[Kitasatospora] papulosa TaxID=1464011 RepID=UPI00368A11A9